VTHLLGLGAVSYAGARWWAAGITAAVFIVALWLLGAAAPAQPSTRGGTPGQPATGGRTMARILRPFLGADGRVSTSHTVALAWTAVVTFILVALVIADPKSWLHALEHLSPTYLLLLGFPYAALVFGKATVATRVASGSLVKPASTQPATVSQLFNDDSGNTDLFDVQYVACNVVAMGFVIVQFTRASLVNGFPIIPNGLLLLTGGPAAVYLTNKFMPGGAPTIFSVSPNEVRIGQSFTITGQNLASTGASASPPSVTVGSKAAQTITFTPTSMVVLAPDAGADLGRAVDVGVTAGPGAQATVSGALKVLGRRPTLDGANTGVARVGDDVTLRGDWSVDEAQTLSVLMDTDVFGPTSQPGEGTVTFKVPRLQNLTPERPVPVTVKLGEETSNAINLLISDRPPGGDSRSANGAASAATRVAMGGI